MIRNEATALPTMSRATGGDPPGTMGEMLDGHGKTNATTADRVYVHGNRGDEIVASSAAGLGWLYHHYDARGHCNSRA